jgi:hypothetical protein
MVRFFLRRVCRQVPAALNEEQSAFNEPLVVLSCHTLTRALSSEEIWIIGEADRHSAEER